MDNQSCECSDAAILMLRDNRVEANKNKLACNSLYFASLFSENFNDHQKKEFVINYEISFDTLQSFVNWVNDEGKDSNTVYSEEYHFTVKKSLQKFLPDKCPELLELLELSVIFMAEKLTEDITEMILSICTRFSPDDMLTTWLLAQNLNLKVLEDVALSICLDRLNELPKASLVDLSFENFSKLVCNVNVNSSLAELMNIREAWIKSNSQPPNLPDSSLRFLKGKPEDVIRAMERAKPHYQQCIVGQNSNGAQYIYSWNGESLHKVEELHREIIGGKFVARGFNIYVVGRKKSEHSENFNTTIWRYSMFNKKCYIETILPQRRQCMEVVVLESKLYLLGGIDSNEETCSTMDVYDVYTGVWSKAEEVPEPFRLSPIRSSCVGDGKIFCQRSLVHVYDPLINDWNVFSVDAPPIPGNPGDEYDNIFYLIGLYKQTNFKNPGVYVRNWRPMRKCTTLAIFTIAHDQDIYINVIHNWGQKIINQQVMNGPQLVTFSYSNGRVNVEVGEVNQLTKAKNTATYQRSKTYSREIQGMPENFFQRSLGCFNLIEPKTLHTTITMPEYVKIGNEFTLVQRKRRKNKLKAFEMSK